MSFGTNLQYLRQLSGNMTQESLAEKMSVSRQTISKWEMDTAKPEMDKALELCKVFNCTLDNLFRDEMDKSIDRVYKYAKENGDENPKVIGWDFQKLSIEQINVYNMHGYTAAWILPEGITPKELEIKEQTEHKYVAIHIDRPFDNPFVTIPGAYHTLNDYMRTNGLVYVENEVIPCFETDGESMDVYIACK